MMNRDREVDMSQYELPDEEPLDDAELARLDAQRDRSRAALVSRGASIGKTPMEMFASGAVTAEAPDDRLVYDQSRQLPSADVHEEVEQGERTFIAIDPARDPDDSVMTIHLGARQTGKSEMRTRMEEWLAKDGGRSFREGFDGYFQRDAIREEKAVPEDAEDIVDAEVVEETITYDND